jgi:twitching motility protein PilT
MVLVTGPAGSGKSTTLACMIDRINRETSSHIIRWRIHRVPAPAPEIHRQPAGGWAGRLGLRGRAARRAAPGADVILLGEMRDFETIQPR